MRRAISSTGRKQIRRSAPFGYGISSPTPAACRKSLSRKNWSSGGSCSLTDRKNENEGNEQVVGTLKTYFDKNKDRQYNAKVEYDENKFVKYINLTILPKEE